MNVNDRVIKEIIASCEPLAEPLVLRMGFVHYN